MYTARQSNKNATEKQILAKRLRSYLLAVPGGRMAEAAENIATAALHRFPARVVYEKPPVVDVVPLLEALNIDFTVVSSTVSEFDKKWSQILIPATSRRVEDFELLIPYYLTSVVQELTLRYPTRITEIEGLFIPYLFYALGQRKRTLHEILKDAIAGSQSGMLMARPSDMRDSSPDGFYEYLRNLSVLSRWYVGVISDSDQLPEIRSKSAAIPVVESELENHPINILAEKALEFKHHPFLWMTVSKHNLRMYKRSQRQIPFYIRRIFFRFQDIGLAARSFASLCDPASVTDVERLLRCLTVRLAGKSEKEIRGALGFMAEDAAAYNKFLNDNHIGMTAGRDMTAAAIYKRWEEARNELGLSEGLIELTVSPNDEVNRPATISLTKENLGRTGNTQGSQKVTLPTKSSTLDLPDDLEWREISIIFVSEHTALVKARDFAQEWGFHALGFVDKRRSRGKSEVPNSRWRVLQAMAKCGQVSWQSEIDPQTKAGLKAAIRDIRVTLKRTFKIDDDPFEPYQTMRKYKPKFTITDNRPESKDG
jgi:hypothetical protein